MASTSNTSPIRNRQIRPTRDSGYIGALRGGMIPCWMPLPFQAASRATTPTMNPTMVVNVSGSVIDTLHRPSSRMHRLRFCRGRCCVDFIAPTLKPPSQEIADSCFILDDENTHPNPLFTIEWNFRRAEVTQLVETKGWFVSRKGGSSDFSETGSPHPSAINIRLVASGSSITSPTFTELRSTPFSLNASFFMS